MHSKAVLNVSKYQGSRPEWRISSMIYSRDTPFWSETLKILQENSLSLSLSLSLSPSLFLFPSLSLSLTTPSLWLSPDPLYKEKESNVKS